MQSISIVLIRNQLRLNYNPLWKLAHDNGLPILPIWISPNWSESHILTPFPRIGNIRKKFLLESYLALQREFEKLGGNITSVSELDWQDPKRNFWLDLERRYKISKVIIAYEPGHDEKLFLDHTKILCEEKGIPFQAIDCNGIFNEENFPIKFSSIPEVFTEFRKKIEKDREFPIRQDLEDFPETEILQLGLVDLKSSICEERNQSLIDLLNSIQSKVDVRSVLDFQGGEEEGLERLKEYFWNTDSLREYKDTRNRLIGANYSSKFSPWLATGSLSPIKIYKEILRYECERVANDSTYWMKFELLWREFFRWMLYKHGKKVFSYSGLRNRTPIGLENNLEKFDSWRLGETGDEFVDANMRELLYTGFMSNRGRQNVASFLVHGMNVDWRLGAEWFETQLIDYDVSSNWGNWNYIAGVGNDPRNRVFNTEKQAKDYDPKGEYRMLWKEDFHRQN